MKRSTLLLGSAALGALWFAWWRRRSNPQLDQAYTRAPAAVTCLGLGCTSEETLVATYAPKGPLGRRR